MDKNNQSKQEKDPLKLLKEAFGFDENQLAEEFEQAEKQMTHPPQPEDVQDRYQKLIKAIEERGIRPEYLEVEKKRKTVGIRRIGKPLLVAVIAAALLVGMGITVMGKRYYAYQSHSVKNGKEIRIRNDGQEIYSEDNTLAIYSAIEENLGVKVLMLNNLPGAFEFDSAEIVNEHAKISFKIDNEYVYFLQMKYDVEMVGGYSSDCVNFTQIYNEWLDITIPISKNILENNDVEYRAEFTIGDSFYILTSKIKEDLFNEIVQGITYYKGGRTDEK